MQVLAPNSHANVKRTAANRFVDALLRELRGDLDRGAFNAATFLMSIDGAQVHSFSLTREDQPQNVNEHTVFPAFSMSKFVTSLLTVQAIEAGELRLDDPIEAYFPQFSALTVLGFDGEVQPIVTSITVRHLLLHTSGLDGSGYGRPEISEAYQQAGLYKFVPGRPNDCADIADFVRRITGVPLAFHPGTFWRYSRSTDVLACLLSKIRRSHFEQVFQQSLAEPLGLTGTSFKESRYDWPHPTRRFGNAKLMVAPPPAQECSADQTLQLPFVSGSSGLFTTAADYLKIAEQLLDPNEQQSPRLIRDTGLHMILTDALSHPIGADPGGFPGQEWGFGYGLGVDSRRIGKRLGWMSRGGSCFIVERDLGIAAILMLNCSHSNFQRFFGHLRTAFDTSFATDHALMGKEAWK